MDNICRCDYENKFPDFSALLTYNESAETMHLQWIIDRSTDQLDESELRGFVVRWVDLNLMSIIISLNHPKLYPLPVTTRCTMEGRLNMI